MRKKSVLLIFSILLTSFLFYSCSDSEPRIGFFSAKATVIITLGLQQEHSQARNSFIDRIFSFFVSDAVAQSAPAAFSSITVTISAVDMTTIVKQYTATDTISFELNPGNARQFEISALVSPTDPTVAVTYKGTASGVNLTANQTIYLPIQMKLDEMKLLIPDNQNNRLVQMNDLTGAGWIEKNGTQLLGAGSFSIYDIDVDSRGRIYFTSSSNDARGKVYRINNINDIPASVSFGPGSGAYALAIDRTRNIVYYTSGSTANTLNRCDYDGNNLPPALAISLTNITSLTVDQDTGMLYGIGSSGSPVIFKYDPTIPVPGIVTSVPLTLGGSYTAGDVMAKNSNLYVSLYYGSLQNKIVVMNSNLVLAGTELLQSPLGDAFWRPTHFLPLINRKYFICDESGSMNDRIIGFDDMSGAGWQTFKATDIGKTAFYFYSMC